MFVFVAVGLNTLLGKVLSYRRLHFNRLHIDNLETPWHWCNVRVTMQYPPEDRRCVHTPSAPQSALIGGHSMTGLQTLPDMIWPRLVPQPDATMNIVGIWSPATQIWANSGMYWCRVVPLSYIFYRTSQKTPKSHHEDDFVCSKYDLCVTLNTAVMYSLLCRIGPLHNGICVNLIIKWSCNLFVQL